VKLLPQLVLRSCAPEGLSEAARALGGSPVEASPGKLLLLLFRAKSGLTGADDRAFFCSFFAVCGAIELLDLSFSPNANPRKFSSATLVESAA
jgi:hypothetical protein